LVDVFGAVICATWEPEVAPAGGREVRGRHGGEGRLALDQDRAAAGRERGDAGRAATRERVEHETVGWGIQTYELRHQPDRLRGRVAVRVAHLGDVEHVLKAAGAGIGEDVGRPAAAFVGAVGLAAVEVGGEHAPPAPEERVRAPCLLPIASVTPGDPRLVDVRHEWRPRLARDDDGRERRPRLHDRARPSGRVQPQAVAFDDEARAFDGRCQAMPGTIVADERQPAAGSQHLEEQAQELDRRQHVPGARADTVGWVGDHGVERIRRERRQHVGGVSTEQVDAVTERYGVTDRRRLRPGSRSIAATWFRPAITPHFRPPFAHTTSPVRGPHSVTAAGGAVQQ
jgi:hypothetical protein